MKPLGGIFATHVGFAFIDQWQMVLEMLKFDHWYISEDSEGENGNSGGECCQNDNLNNFKFNKYYDQHQIFIVSMMLMLPKYDDQF